MRSNQTFRPRFDRNNHRLFGNLSRTLIAVLTGAVAVLGILPEHASANPNTKDYKKPLNAQGTIDGAQKQIELMYGKFVEWEKLAISSTELMKAGRKFPHQQLSRIFPETYRGIWHAQHLQAMGEPAGYDLELKYTQLRRALFVFAAKLGEFQPKEIAKLRKETAKRQQALAKIQTLADQGKWAEAGRLIEALHMRQLASVFYLTSSQSRPFENEVAHPQNAILAKLNAQRRQEYGQRAQEKIDAYRNAVDTLQAESSRVASELRQSPTVTLADGKTGDAADAIGYVRTLWGNSTAAINRSFGVALAFNNGSSESISKSFSKELDRAETVANRSLAGILNAAAASTPPDKVAALLPRVLLQLSVIDRRNTGRMDNSIAPLVEKLTSKNQALADQAKRYSAAIAEPTRWMHRYTIQQVKHLDREYPAAAILLNRKLKPQASVRPTIYGPSNQGERVLTPSTLTQPASWLAGDAKMLVGMNATVESSVRISPSIKTSIVPLTATHYANVPATLQIGRCLADLKDSLLLDESHGPLDLSAADALSSANLQEFRNTGGEIVRLTLEPVVVRLATLPDAAQVLVPLDRLPDIGTDGPVVGKLVWRVDLQPTWVAHELFFAKVN